MPRFNRLISFSVMEMDGPNEVGVYRDLNFGEPTLYEDGQTPFDMSVNIQKSFNSSPDSATVTIQNHPIIKTWYEEGRQIMEDMAEKEFRLYIATGYTDVFEVHNVYVGDLTSYSLQGGQSLTDHAIILKASASHRAQNQQKLQTIFGVGTTYREMIETIFQSWIDDWGADDVFTIFDPDAKLDVELLKPETVDKNAWETVGDLCNEVDFVFGHDRGRWWCGPKTGVFDPKEEILDVQDLNYETGKVGVIGFDRSQFTFSHYPDKQLQIGIGINATDFPQIDVNPQPFDGRINRINMNLSMFGDNMYNVEAQHRDEDQAIMPDKRTTENGALLL